MRIAIYARVSTEDQTSENQLRELREWCRKHDHTITKEYVEAETGTKGTAKRKAFAQLFKDAARHRFDCVLFWALDRFSREGMMATVQHLQRLDVCGGSEEDPGADRCGATTGKGSREDARPSKGGG